MRARLAACTLFAFLLSSFATTTPSNASLNGAYSMELANAHLNSWGQNLTCNGNNVFMGGSQVREQGITGTLNFNGSGGVTGSFTEYGHFNSAASNATVSCTSNGHAVYDAPAPGTLTGTYSIQSSGDGTASITVSGGAGGNNGGVGTLNLKLAGQCASGLSNTVMVVILRSDNSVESSGILRYQSTC